METLIEILQELHPEVDFRTCHTLVEDKIIDSFDIVSLVAEIHSEFNVAIPPEEIIPENFNSAEALYRLIQRLEEED